MVVRAGLRVYAHRNVYEAYRRQLLTASADIYTKHPTNLYIFLASFPV